jgi:hypothetical protein
MEKISKRMHSHNVGVNEECGSGTGLGHYCFLSRETEENIG